jgi:hypothetical protein
MPARAGLDRRLAWWVMGAIITLKLLPALAGLLDALLTSGSQGASPTTGMLLRR